ncbi:glycosyltransferase family 9 protein [Tenacibaculum sp. UWU-22]|uniref:glycosyltransferase family 9 protein n=1 Tax=Tenacibaculum sp. UWU-22 TaxID=3234187 RepID=UPI0034DB70DA
MLKNQHIIVFRLSAMGDVAMTVPVLRAFTLQYPEVKITVVSKGFLRPIFEGIKNVTFYEAAVKEKHKGLLGLRKLYKELKALQPTHIADLHNVTRSIIVRNFFKIDGFPVAYIDKGRAEKKALTRINNKVFKQLKTTHQRYVEVFEKLGFLVDITNAEPIQVPKLTPEVIQVTGNKTQPWIGIAPFAAFASKEYPIDLLEKVILQLVEKKYLIFLFGGKSDANTLESIEKKYNQVISTANKLGGLTNELNLIGNLSLMLSMDSGNAHLAAMQGIKTVTLWGSTHPFAGFAPYNQPIDYCLLPDLKQYPNLPCSIYGNKTCQGYEDVMRTINPNTVVDKINEILKQ